MSRGVGKTHAPALSSEPVGSAGRGARPGAMRVCPEATAPVWSGIRQRLPRRSGRAGDPDRGRSGAVVARSARGRLLPPALPRRWRGGRGSASPLRSWGAASPVGPLGATGGCHPRPVGVRRCLTRRPSGPAHAGGDSSAVVSGNVAAVSHAALRVAAPSGRPGEAAPRPYRGMPCIPGGAFVRDGWAQSLFGRGQAVPDPPARQGRQSSRRAVMTVARRRSRPP